MAELVFRFAWRGQRLWLVPWAAKPNGTCALHILNPHAAPWFHEGYPAGTVPDYSFPGNAAGLVRVDDVLGTHLYTDGFRRGTVVFGAIPSLYAAAAVCCALFVARYGGPPGSAGMAVHVALMCWSTMYFLHHFAVDLIADAAIVPPFLCRLRPARAALARLRTRTRCLCTRQ